MSYLAVKVRVPGVTYNSRSGELPKNSPLPFDTFVGTEAEAKAAGYEVIESAREFKGEATPGLVQNFISPSDYLQMYGGGGAD